MAPPGWAARRQAPLAAHAAVPAAAIPTALCFPHTPPPRSPSPRSPNNTVASRARSLAALTSEGLCQIVSRAPARSAQGGSGTHSCSMLASSQELLPSSPLMHRAPALSAEAKRMLLSATRSSSDTKPPPKLPCTCGGRRAGGRARVRRRGSGGAERGTGAIEGVQARERKHCFTRQGASDAIRSRALHAPSRPPRPAPEGPPARVRTTKGLGRGRSWSQSVGQSSTSSPASGAST